MNIKALMYVAGKTVPSSMRHFGEAHVLSKHESKELRKVEKLLGTPLPTECHLVQVTYIINQKVCATVILNGDTKDILRKYGPVFH